MKSYNHKCIKDEGQSYIYIYMYRLYPSARAISDLSLSVLQQRHIRNDYNHTHLDQAYNV